MSHEGHQEARRECEGGLRKAEGGRMKDEAGGGRVLVGEHLRVYRELRPAARESGSQVLCGDLCH